MRVTANPTPTPQSQRSQAQIDERKALLRQRLAQNQDRRQAHEQSKQTADLKSQTKSFFMAESRLNLEVKLIELLITSSFVLSICLRKVNIGGLEAGRK